MASKIPYYIPTSYIDSAAVKSKSCKEMLISAGFDKEIQIRPKEFF